MSDRSWNRIYRSIYEERWSFEAKEIAIYLIAHCVNQYGVYKIPWWSMEKYFSKWFDVGIIQKAIDELKVEKFLRTYDNDDIVFILTKWAKETDNNPSNRQRVGAFKFISHTYPDILADFLEQYPVLEEYVETEVNEKTEDLIPSDTHGIPIAIPLPENAPDTKNRNNKLKKTGAKKGENKVIPLHTHSDVSVSESVSVIPDSDTDSDSEYLNTTASAVLEEKGKFPSPLEKQRAKSTLVSDAYQAEFFEFYGRKPIWNSATGKRIRILLQDFDGDVERITDAIHQAFHTKDPLIIQNRTSFISLTGPSIFARCDAEVAREKKKTAGKSIEDPEKYGKPGEAKL